MKKIQNIQCLRGLAALAVVLCHISISQAHLCGHATYLTSLFGNGWAGVDLFFVISGFVMVKVTIGKCGNPINALKFAFDRLFRIFPLYWAISAVVLVIFIIHPGVFHNIGHPSFWRSFLLLPQNQQNPLVGQAWTLIYEMYFYYVFTALLLVPERFMTAALLSWATALIIVSLTFPAVSSWPVLATIKDPICLEFVLGALVGKIVCSGFKQYARQAIIVGTATIVISATCIPRSYGIESWARVLLFGLPSAILTYGAVASEGRVRLPRWLARLGDCSYSLYLIHMLPIGAVALLSSRLPRDVKLVAGPVMLFAAVASGELGYHLLELRAMRIVKRIRPLLFGDFINQEQRTGLRIRTARGAISTTIPFPKEAESDH